MVPFLAPLFGSMAASLLPATVGTGIAGALGLSGAGAGLIAAAAPKALGAGLGTLLAGGDLGDAALNAVGFGAGSTALSSMMGNAPGAAGSTNAEDAIRAITQGLGGGQGSQPSMMPAPAPVRPEQTMRNDIMAPPMQNQPMDAVNQMASTTVPSVAGIASLPVNGQPMNNDTMLAGFSPDQDNMIRDYLRGQGMGFA